MKILLVNAVLLFYICKNVVADLPIHATIGDMIGKWKFDLSKEVKGENVYCGSALPNTLEGDLKLGDYKKLMTNNYELGNTLELELTLDPIQYINVSKAKNREKWISLAVKSYGNTVGHWTAIYDQGFRITLNNGYDLLLYFYFEKIEENKYATDPTRTLIGWASKRDGNNFTHYCCYGEKKNSGENNVYNTVDTTETGYERFARDLIRVVNGKKNFHPVTNKGWSEYNVSYFCKCSKESRDNGNSNLPKNFSWDRFDNIQIVDQKGCGGCYTIASLFVLHSRFLIRIREMLKTPEYKSDARLLHLEKVLTEKNFNINMSLSCIPYNQGCKGGFPVNVGKFAQEFGLVLDDEKPEEIVDNLSCAPKGDNLRLYASNVEYIGGCYECTRCSGETLIMSEIMENGPVVAGIDGEHIRKYKDSVINPSKEDLRKHRGLCEFNEKFLSGLEFTTHAVVLVGWGETDEGFKFWVARNSWGKNWGDGGFFKIVRGINAFGIESEAVVLDPDVEKVLKNTTEQPINSHELTQTLL
ncbi:cysteine proteinase, putative [Theileria annulata]|uniref:Dipeptidyl peptidase 1 n=1 Tax=Theileria annulata TaxID=5874 RepID=Q4UC83_THEAN|nr:cysteine proteinase, putative [Theileria annulata]CAI75568.1 cysteine proteinase, putative [Theileria annulata]|eukprot:XP_955044.1 cysteine proteinase, putative [Theileria annulata]